MNCNVGEATKGWRMSCNVDEVMERLENEQSCDVGEATEGLENQL